MAEEFIQFTFDKKFKRELEKYIEKKGEVVSKKLRAKMLESAEYLKKMMVRYAPLGETSRLKTIIASLPVTSKGTKISLTQDGKMQIVINLGRKKDQRILWADRGTGIYGPNRRVIRPTNGEFLWFEVNGQLIRTRTVKGQRGKRFIRSAINASKLIIVTKVRSGLKD